MVDHIGALPSVDIVQNSLYRPATVNEVGPKNVGSRKAGTDDPELDTLIVRVLIPRDSLPCCSISVDDHCNVMAQVGKKLAQEPNMNGVASDMPIWVETGREKKTQRFHRERSV